MEAATGWAWAVTGSHRGSQAWGFSFSQSKRVPAELSETATSCWSSNITSPLYLTALALAICATVFLQMSARLAPALPLYICSNVTLCLKPSMKQEPLSTHTGTHTHTHSLCPVFFSIAVSLSDMLTLLVYLDVVFFSHSHEFMYP